MSDIERQEINDIIETLENLEQSLIEYEESFDADRENDSLIHIIFRYAHNLKSTLAMIHKDYSSELIHSVENNFDLIRSGKMSAGRELIDKTLDAIDLIKSNLFRKEETRDELEELKQIFDALKDEPAEQKAASISFLLDAKQQQIIADAVGSGSDLYQIEKLIKSDIDRETYENLPIYSDVEEIGTLVASWPPFDKIDTSKEEAIVKILLVTDKSEDDLFYTIFDPFKKIDIPGVGGGAEKKEEEEYGQPAPPEPPMQETQPPELQQQPESQPELQQQPVPDKKLEILIVEDDFTTRHLEMKILETFGNCEVAVDGNEAVRVFEQRSLDERPYDLILLDILIPSIDGHEVLRRIRTFEAERGIYGFDQVKVVIVSNLRDMENIAKSFREQSDSYIVKPVTKKKVERELRRINLL